MAATEKLNPLLATRSNAGGSWRVDRKYFYSGTPQSPEGSVNLAAAWFQMGHEVSVSA